MIHTIRTFSLRRNGWRICVKFSSLCLNDLNQFPSNLWISWHFTKIDFIDMNWWTRRLCSYHRFYPKSQCSEVALSMVGAASIDFHSFSSACILHMCTLCCETVKKRRLKPRKHFSLSISIRFFLFDFSIHRIAWHVTAVCAATFIDCACVCVCVCMHSVASWLNNLSIGLQTMANIYQIKLLFEWTGKH